MTPAPSHRVVPLEGKFAVVIARSDDPDWLKVVAKFDSRERANGFCELKNFYPEANIGRPWTDKENDWLELAWELGTPTLEIAEHLKRTSGGVRMRAVHIGLKARPGGGGRRKAKAPKRPTGKPAERQAALNAESRAALDKSQQERATQKFGEPKQRRCQSCAQFFECTRIEDILCPECEGRRFEVRA